MADAASQSEVIRLLSDPATHDGAPVQRIDTHASAVFLAGPRALKLKRAVKYDYLDFSTVERRKACCEAELRINGRTAPALYRGVLPVVRPPNGPLALGGEGPAVDWVVEMVRFDQDALFDRLAASGRLELAMVARLAEEIASFHDGCEPRRTGAAPRAWHALSMATRRGCPIRNDLLDSNACQLLAASARAALRRTSALLESRRTAGLVRQCHGDLHLGNIVLFDGRPTLFDAIEFNDDIACIDVMYDLAFLLMDLCHRGLPRHANVVFNSYLGVTQDLDALAALPLFLSCRAAIRAKTCATAARLQASPDAQRGMRSRAREYLALANRLLEPSAPAIVAIGGLSGSGKSTLARALAATVGRAPGAVLLRTDDIRKRLYGVTPLTRLGPLAYTREVSARVYEALAGAAAVVIEAGHSAIVDAVFARAEDRAVVEQTAKRTHARFAGLWLDAPEQVLIERVSERGPDVSDADAGVVRMQLAQWAGHPPWCRVDAAGSAVDVQANARLCLQSQAVARDTGDSPAAEYSTST